MASKNVLARTNVTARSLLSNLRADNEVDRRIVEVLELLDDRDNLVNGGVLEATEPKADRTKLIPVQHNFGDFTAAAPMAWIVGAAGFHSLTYSIQDDMMEVQWFLEGTLTTLPSNSIFINIPALKLGTGKIVGAVFDNFYGSHEWADAGGVGIGRAQVNAGAGTIQLIKAGAGNYVIGAMYTIGAIRFGINNAMFRN